MIFERPWFSILNVFSLIALTPALFLLWSIHTDSPAILNSPEVHLWQQPHSISNEFPERISATHWQFDFEATEQVLTKIKLNETGELILNETTADLLKVAVSKLPLNMTEADLQRIEILVAKGLPGKVGQQLSDVLTGFYRYWQIERIDENNALNIEDKERSFEQTVLLQERYLGKDVAEHLFGRKNAVTRYLYARRRINEDSNLNQAQKRQQLIILQNRFKANEQ